MALAYGGDPRQIAALQQQLNQHRQNLQSYMKDHGLGQPAPAAGSGSQTQAGNPFEEQDRQDAQNAAAQQQKQQAADLEQGDKNKAQALPMIQASYNLGKLPELGQMTMAQLKERNPELFNKIQEVHGRVSQAGKPLVGDFMQQTAGGLRSYQGGSSIGHALGDLQKWHRQPRTRPRQRLHKVSITSNF